MQNKPSEEVAAALGLVEKFHGSKSDNITADQAGQMAEILGRMRQYLSLGDSLLQACIELNQAFLEKRQPQKTFTETLH